MKTKMLSFYFTFFELLTANRSYVTMSLKKYDSNIKNLLQLSGLKEFLTYVNIITDDFRTKAVSRISNKINSGKFLDSVVITLKFR
jgi:hypothetical protein